ncbi:Bidirectional sugar transporter SWEET17 [Hibiscus syriacus]|uniref:Bidirectional sugar transporter SWEET17 n=1 Tax=Hibiscus syriacus TaxID=106335 RepID=A0A6A3D483_HIBSY|nr:Bidirectional sugar transporter SWEET17 [Hibiscus syriacus]
MHHLFYFGYVYYTHRPINHYFLSRNHYGITKPGGVLVATVNGFGVFVEAVYAVLFLLYAPKNTRVKTGILVGIVDVGFLAAAIVVTQFALEGETRIGAIGFMGCGLNIIMYGSPLPAMVSTFHDLDTSNFF